MMIKIKRCWSKLLQLFCEAHETVEWYNQLKHKKHLKEKNEWNIVLIRIEFAKTKHLNKKCFLIEFVLTIIWTFLKEKVQRLIFSLIESKQVALVWGLAELFLVAIVPLNYKQFIYLKENRDFNVPYKKCSFDLCGHKSKQSINQTNNLFLQDSSLWEGE